MSGRKRILLVNNNMKIGGVQKALLEVLRQIHGVYDVTLLLFCKTGALLEQVPADVRILETGSHYRFLGISQAECTGRREKLTRGFYAGLSRLFGISPVLRLMDRTLPRTEPEVYDLAVSFLHCSGRRTCYGGVAEYVLSRTKAKQRACYIHCDYLHAGLCSRHSRKIYRNYDKLVCVSQSVRRAFLQVQPELTDRTVVVENPLSPERIRVLADAETCRTDRSWLNLVTVSRLAGEKGLDRLIRVLSRLKDCRIRCRIVGGGPEGKNLERLVREYGLEDRVFFEGERENPYPDMAAADLLCLPSRHEAAPVVIQEAKVLGLPVLTTRTLSAEEMVPPEYGFIVGEPEEMEQILRRLSGDASLLAAKKQALKTYEYSDGRFWQQFRSLTGENEAE